MKNRKMNVNAGTVWILDAWTKDRLKDLARPRTRLVEGFFDDYLIKIPLTEETKGGLSWPSPSAD